MRKPSANPSPLHPRRVAHRPFTMSEPVVCLRAFSRPQLKPKDICHRGHRARKEFTEATTLLCDLGSDLLPSVSQILSHRVHQPSQEPPLILPGEFMLPNPQHPPAAGAERAGDETTWRVEAWRRPLARPVAGEFPAPELRVLLRLRGVDGTSVPKATVDDHGRLA